MPSAGITYVPPEPLGRLDEEPLHVKVPVPYVSVKLPCESTDPDQGWLLVQEEVVVLQVAE